MHRETRKPPFSDYDMMTIRAGGRSQSEVEASYIWWAELPGRLRAAASVQRTKIALWWGYVWNSKGA